MPVAEKILILDYGSQFTQLIARRVRELGVYGEIYAHDCSKERIAEFAPAGIILSGGPQSVLAADAPAMNEAIFELGVPILGLCYGMQLLTQYGGGQVVAEGGCEYGNASVRITQSPQSPCPLFADIETDTLQVWMSHGDHVQQLAAGYEVVARSNDDADGVIAAIADVKRRYYGLQFHPEVAHTEHGSHLLENFVRRICTLRATWTMPNFIKQAVTDITEKVGDAHVLLALSGGVDSAVTAALLHRAIGQQLVCVLVDNGLLRRGEVESVRSVFEQQFGIKLIVIDAAERFYQELAGIVDSEEKRRRIGHLFIKVFEEQATNLGEQIQWLGQGTIYPDVVESGKVGNSKATIKTHHNVGGLPEHLNLHLIEPLRDLFKDEVRRLGEELGLAHTLMWRHPFPGPGLAVRVLGEVTAARVATVRQADDIFLTEMQASGAYEQTAQAFAVLLPVQSVGVMGDERTYEDVIALRAVTSSDFMTADWARLNNDLLARVSSRIINEVAGVNRVVYDISSKPPATIEWE
ncbi:MAG: glutamine-hydrolyzing GMP synthase [Proteobacteria bacterium]|nr:glutamine-hydrolyzing GMP synthase [Pseudomonadota bacterium]